MDLKTITDLDDRAILLQVVGNVTEDNVKTTGDDGVSQAVAIKQGLASKSGCESTESSEFGTLSDIP